jgi:hypothetical protein
MSLLFMLTARRVLRRRLDAGGEAREGGGDESEEG